MNSHLQVLLVEDVKIAQTVATIILENLGHHVDIAENGEQAIILFEKKHYDLIFMDISLPTENGFEITKRLRELEFGHVHTPIIALSANYDTSYKAACLEVGMDDFLSKPLTKNNAVNMVNRYYALPN